MARKYFSNNTTTHEAILDSVARDLTYVQIHEEVKHDFHYHLGYKMYLKYKSEFEKGLSEDLEQRSTQSFSTQSFCEELELKTKETWFDKVKGLFS